MSDFRDRHENDRSLLVPRELPAPATALLGSGLGAQSEVGQLQRVMSTTAGSKCCAMLKSNRTQFRETALTARNGPLS